MKSSRIKLSRAVPALALAAAIVAPMPQAMHALSAAPAALASGNPCATSNPCAPSSGKKMDKKMEKKAGNPCAPASKKKSNNPCAPSN